ncbi:MAG: CHASE2 domain-containing protein, partial [Chloroflexia bacterium]
MGGLEMPAPFPGVYVNEYEVASLPPGEGRLAADAVARPPSGLAVLRRARHLPAPPTGARTSNAQASRSEMAARIPVSKHGTSLDMILDYAPSDKVKDATYEYKEVYDWTNSSDQATRGHMKEHFNSAIVIIGYNTDVDRHHIIIGGGARPGVAIHANAVSNLLNGVYIPQAPGWCNFLAILTMAGLGVLIQTKFRQLRAHRLILDLPYVGKVGFPALLLGTLLLYLVGAA